MLRRLVSRKPASILLCLVAVIAIDLAALAQDSPAPFPTEVLIKNAVIMTATHGNIPNGSIYVKDGKIADVVVWRPAFFGIKPELVIKGGFIAWGAMGDSAASLMTCEPILMRPQWGAFGRAAPALSASFVHPLAIERGLKAQLGLSKALLPARGTRKLTKSDMLWNDACPNIRVDPQTFDVFVDGSLATCEPARVLPLAQRYMLR